MVESTAVGGGQSQVQAVEVAQMVCEIMLERRGEIKGKKRKRNWRKGRGGPCVPDKREKKMRPVDARFCQY